MANESYYADLRRRLGYVPLEGARKAGRIPGPTLEEMAAAAGLPAAKARAPLQPKAETLARLQRDAEPAASRDGWRLDRLVPERRATLTLAKPTSPAEPPPQPRHYFRWAAPWEIGDDSRLLAEKAARAAAEALRILPPEVRWVAECGASKAVLILLGPKLWAWTPSHGKSAWFCIDSAVPQQRIIEAVAHEAHHIAQRWAGKTSSEEGAQRWAAKFVADCRRGVYAGL